MIRIEIENRLEEHERHAVESDRVVAEPAPRQPRILAAAEPVLLGAGRIGVVQIAVDRLLAFGDLRRPVGHDLPVDPRHDVLARVVLERAPRALPWPVPRRLRIPGPRVRGATAAPAQRRGQRGRRPDACDSMESTCTSPRLSVAGDVRPEAPRRAGVGKPQGKRGGVEVLVVELQAAEAALERERRLARSRLRTRRDPADPAARSSTRR